MDKKKIRNFLKTAHLIEPCYREGEEFTAVMRKEKEVIYRTGEAYGKFRRYVRDILASEKDGYVAEIIERMVYKGQSDRQIIADLPFCEGVFYEKKRNIVGKIFELSVLDGDVSKEDILRSTI